MIVIGAGMSGILCGIRLQEAGLDDDVIYEQADRPGGTWRDNTYPGLTCDVPSHVYSYSFEPNPDWTRCFSPGPEIRAYFDRVADEYGVTKRIECGVAIERVERRDVRTVDGALHELDVLVFATGFRAHDYMAPMAVLNDRGRALADVWDPAPFAYRSVSVPGFPNFFMVVGPHSPTGNFSLIGVSELQVDYILQLIERARSSASGRIVATAEATERFDVAMRERIQGSIWMTGCRSWYLDANGVAATWPWGVTRFQQEMQRPDFGDFSCD